MKQRKHVTIKLWETTRITLQQLSDLENESIVRIMDRLAQTELAEQMRLIENAERKE